MLKRFMGVAAGAAVATAAATAEEPSSFELLAATLDGRLTMAIVNHNGIAVAIELQDETPEIIQGLAAGAILSDLREIVTQGDEAPALIEIASGSTHSQVRVDGAMRVGHASRAQTEEVLRGLPNMTPERLQELRSLLSL